MTKESTEKTAAAKLQLLKSPLIPAENHQPFGLPTVSPGPDLNLFGDRFGSHQDCPEFQKHEDASLLELFFDLFFAANYTVFSQTQSVNSHERFKAYVGYFCILWITWLVVGLYDVRFVTDSIFERAARGVHLGVMVGFAVVAPNFNPNDQNMQTMRTMSVILAVSRLCLAVEYGSILWHIRKYKRQRVPMLAQISLNLIASLIYLGVTFRFRDEKNSRVFVAWYVISCVEVAITFVMAWVWPVLSFSGTHLMKRMSLLTVIILGDGIIVVVQSVVTIVESPDAWNSQTIGIVTAATVTIYFVFLVYFDWMKQPHLPVFRQQLWTCLHFPFHLALVLFMQGFTQFIIWSKIIDTLGNMTFDSILNSASEVAQTTSEQVSDNLYNITTEFFERYPPKYYSTWESVSEGLNNISRISDDYWPQIAKYSETLAKEDLPSQDDNQAFYQAFIAITTSMENALLETFGIDLVQELSESDDASDDIQGGGFEIQVNQETWDRFDLVFSYAYIAAGITLILMTILTIVSHVKPWRPWSIIRTTLFLLLGVGTSLVSLLYYSPVKASKFQASPWLLPTICIVWVVVLLLTHLRNPPPLFFANSAKDSTTYGPVEVPRASDVPAEHNTMQHPQINPETLRRMSFYGQTGYDGTSYSTYDSSVLDRPPQPYEPNR